MQPYWTKNLRKVTPYVPGEQPQGNDIIKLNTNENPYPPSPKVDEVIKGINTDFFAKYPDPTASVLVEKLAAYYGVKASQVFVGTGSDDVLSTAFMTFFNSEKPVLFPDITYSFYPVWANVYNIPFKTVPLDDDFRVRVDDYIRGGADDGSSSKCDTADGECDDTSSADDTGIGGIVIANPNAPTSIAMFLDDIEIIIKKNPDVIVIIDEAYIDYGGDSALPLLEKYDNLLIVRTFSKSRAMAGMRIGFAIGNERAIEAMKDVAASVNSYTMTCDALYAGAASVDDDEYFKKRIADVISTREMSIKRLKEMGFEVLPSQTNFLFAKHPAHSGSDIFEKLRQKNIYVRHFNSNRINEYLRITIGTDAQMGRLFAELEKLI